MNHSAMSCVVHALGVYVLVTFKKFCCDLLFDVAHGAGDVVAVYLPERVQIPFDLSMN